MVRNEALILAAALALATGGAIAKEYPIGKASVQNGLSVSAVYLQPIEMEPAGMMRKTAESDVHLEADIKGARGNGNGFKSGEWVPALRVRYELVKLENGKEAGKPIAGDLMAMVANDGPHYGDNVKLDGPGRYRLKLTITPPGPDSHFGRHVDRETGVAEWFKPFDVVQDFVFAGTGKKGAY